MLSILPLNVTTSGRPEQTREPAPRLASTGPAYREVALPKALQPYLECLWWREVAESDPHTLVVPDGCIDLIWSDNAAPLIAGPATKPIVAKLASGSSVVGVRFRPGIAPRLLDVPAYELLDIHVPLAAVWEGDVRTLRERGEARSDAETRLALLAELVGSRIVGTPRPDDDVVRAGRWLMEHRPHRPVQALAGALFVSERHLLRRFTQAMGYGPKTFARVMRFQYALRQMTQSSSAPLAQVATTAGFADQAHMTRDFYQLSGLLPSELSRDKTAR